MRRAVAAAARIETEEKSDVSMGACYACNGCGKCRSWIKGFDGSCLMCGAEVPDGAKRCSKCGAPIPRPASITMEDATAEEATNNM